MPEAELVGWVGSTGVAVLVVGAGAAGLTGAADGSTSSAPLASPASLGTVKLSANGFLDFSSSRRFR